MKNITKVLVIAILVCTSFLGKSQTIAGTPVLSANGVFVAIQLPDTSAGAIKLSTQGNVTRSIASISATTLGLGNVNNTTDASKPVSTATQAAITAITAASLGAEVTTNKATSLTSASNTTYPTTLAVANAISTFGNGTVTTLTGVAGTGISWSIATPTTTPAITLTLLPTAVGLGNVNNTSDANKPVSTAQAASIATKFTTPTGTTSQFIRGDGSVATTNILVGFNNEWNSNTTASQTSFTLGFAPVGEVIFMRNGLPISKTNFSISGTTLTFSGATAFSANESVFIMEWHY